MSMLKPTLGRPKNLKKRQDILQAAAELFPAKGFANVSMMEIAERAKVSKLTLYSHFNDKEDLFTQSVIDCCEQQLPPSSFQLPANLSLEQALIAIGNGFLELVMDDKAISLHRMMIAQTSIDIQQSELFFKVGPERMLTEMQEFLVKANSSGRLNIAQVEHAAEHFFC
ncbi:MAG: TetR/AcrR family transcriptional regulator, partial [Arenimonas sp.]|nr:TetR/AcrR family transcriptional regulator [Arenimonas sp.]